MPLFQQNKLYFHRSLLTAMLILTTLIIKGVLVKGWVNLGFKYALSYTEGVVTTSIAFLDQFPLLYHDLSKEPFILMPYQPLYVYLSHLVSLSGLGDLTSGRMLTLMSSMATVYLLFLIASKAGAGRLLSAIMAFVFLAIPIVTKNISHVSPDLMALCFTMAGLYSLLKSEEKDRCSKYWFMGIFCFWISFLCKQNYVLGPVAYALYLFTSRQIKKSIVFCAVTMTGMIFSLLAWGVFTEGHYWDHVFFSPSTISNFSFSLVLDQWILYGRPLIILLVLSFLGFFLMPRKRAQRLILIYFVLSLSSTVLAGKIGAGDNYFFEPSALICIMAAIGVHQAVFHRFRFIPGLIIQILVFAQLLQFTPLMKMTYAGAMERRFEKESGLNEFAPVVQKMPEPIYSENIGLLLANGKQVVYQPFEFTQLAVLDKFDEELILEKIRNHEFNLMIITTPFGIVRQSSRYSERFIQAVKKHYKILAHKYDHFFYVPNHEAN